MRWHGMGRMGCQTYDHAIGDESMGAFPRWRWMTWRDSPGRNYAVITGGDYGQWQELQAGITVARPRTLGGGL